MTRRFHITDLGSPVVAVYQSQVGSGRSVDYCHGVRADDLLLACRNMGVKATARWLRPGQACAAFRQAWKLER